MSQIERLRVEQDAKIAELSRFIKAACRPGATPRDRERAEECRREAKALHETLRQLIDDSLRLAGLSEEQITALDVPAAGGERRLKLEEIAPAAVAPTHFLEDVLPKALEA